MISILRHLKRKLRRWLRQNSRYNHLKTDLSIPKVWYGNEYGGFYVSPTHLNSNSIVYSFGVGEDISFDREIIASHDCQVFAFDPTPRVMDWVAKQDIPKSFHFHNVGIGGGNGFVDFFLPINTKHVSGSFVSQSNVDENRKTQVEMKTLASIVSELQHTTIDVLKMDIEGIEYDVLPSILATPVLIKQLLIEFHDRFFDDGREKTISTIQRLRQHGFRLFGVSDSMEELSFINTNVDEER